MSDTTDAVLEQLRTTQRELELDHVQLAGRILQIQHDIALIEHGPRRKPGRPRNVSALNPYPSQSLQQALNTPHMPLRTKGGMAVAETDLPSLDDVQGILKPEPETAA